MKLCKTTRYMALLLAAVMLLAFAPLTSAATVTAHVAVTSTTKVLRAPDTTTTLVTLTPGESVGIIREHPNSSLYYVYVLTEDGDYEYGYMPKSAIPADANAASVSYNATITADTPLYKSTSAETSFRNLTKGAVVGVIRSVGDLYYFVKSDIFYGYVRQSSCVAGGTTATAAPSTAGTAFDLTSADIACYGQVYAGAALYSAPSKTSAVVGTFNTGGTVGVVAQSGTAADNQVGYYYITSGGDYRGYIESTAIVIAPDKMALIPTHTSIANEALNAKTTAASNTAKVANCTSWVSMRQDAKSSSKRLAKVPLGATVTVLGTTGNYTKVTYNKQTGFILSTYIK